MPAITRIETRSPEESALFRRFAGGTNTEADVAELRRLAKAEPDRWTKALDLADVAARDAIERFAAGNRLAAELANARREQLRAELGYDAAPPAERLLIDQIVLAGLRLYEVELLYTDRLNGKHTAAEGTYWDRRLSSAQRRYLRAIETLARVRKLLRTVTVQVNVAERQVNVGQLAAGRPGVSQRLDA